MRVGHQKRVGTLPKDNEKAKGGFGAPLTDALQKAGLELVDLSQGFGQLLAVRDEVCDITVAVLRLQWADDFFAYEHRSKNSTACENRQMHQLKS